jgi:hypothetical protein
MNALMYPLTCPLCREKLEPAGRDGELLLYRCPRHGTVSLCSDGRIWVDELPQFEPNDIRAIKTIVSGRGRAV